MGTEAARIREVWRHFPRSISASLKNISNEIAPDSPFLPSHHIPTHSIDSSLTCIAQVCCLRMQGDVAFVSLIDAGRQYVLAEATPTSNLRLTSPGDGAPNPDDFWIGATSVPRGKLACGVLLDQLAGMTGSIDSLVVDDLAQHPAFKSSQLLRQPDPKRAYVGVPLRSKKGFAIGVLCIYFKAPRLPHADPVDISLMQQLAAATVDLLDARRVREDSQRIEAMTRGLVKFLDNTASPAFAEDHDDAPKASQTLSGQAETTNRIKTPSPVSSTPRRASLTLSTSPKNPPRPSVKTDQSKSSQTTVRNKLDSENESGRSNVSRASKSKIDRSRGNLSGGQNKTSVTMQNILPYQTEAMFTRAARILRSSGELDGVVIFDASIAALNQPRAPQAMTSADRTFGPPTADTLDSQRPARQFDIKKEQERSSSSDTSSSLASESKEQQTCRILGFSHTTTSDDANDAAPPAYLACPESTLRRMLTRYPRGRIINYTPDGRPSSDDSGASASDKGSQDPASPKLKKGDRLLEIFTSMRSLADGATSLAFIPLWDYSRQRYFACCVCWTTQIHRVLSPRLDLIFLKAFGNSIMTELSRLDAMTSDAAKTFFVASISHELRSPLHGILGATEFLSDTSLDSFQANMLHTIAISGRTLLDTLNHVMDYSKMNQHFDNRPRSKVELVDVGHLRLTAQRRRRRDQMSNLNDVTALVDVSKLAEEVVEAVYASQSERVFNDTSVDDDDAMHHHRRRSAELDDNESTLASVEGGEGAEMSDYAASPPQIPDVSVSYRAPGRKIVRVILDIDKTDNWLFTITAGVWRRLIMNLFGNALKFTKSGYIKVSLTANKNAAGLRAGETQITLTIHDTGRGMSTEFLVNNLFGAFRQEDSFSAGIGLGMHIVRQLLETIGGRIDVQTQRTGGTDVVVKLILPDVKDDETDEIDFAKPMDQLKGRKVFVLDTTSAILTDLYAEETSPEMLAKREAADAVRHCLQHTLTDWYGMQVTTGEAWTNPDVDYVICTESSFDQLQEITKHAADGRARVPIIIFIAVDALEAAALRNDVRVQSDYFVCGIIVQPLGPRKLKTILLQSWQRRDERIQRLQMGIGHYPPKGSSFNATMSVTTGGLESIADIDRGNTTTSASTSLSRRPTLNRLQSRQMIQEVLDSGTTSSLASPSVGAYLPVSPSSTMTTPNSVRTLPLTAESVAAAATLAEGRTVLITDDNSINRRLLAAFMHKHKIPYAEAANGQVAVDMYRQNPSRYHLILMDISMPVMDGMTATRHIRKMERERNDQLKHSSATREAANSIAAETTPTPTPGPKSHILILALTGLTSEATRKEALDSGIDHYLTKPVDFIGLLAWINVGSELLRGLDEFPFGEPSNGKKGRKKMMKKRRKRRKDGDHEEAVTGAEDGDEPDDDYDEDEGEP